MSKPIALGGNIFAGLFTVGIRQAGFEVLGHLEHGPYGVATCKKNFGEDFDVRVGRENWREEEFKKKKVDFFYTNPPCAAWSLAGKGGWEDQTDRLRYVYDLVEAALVFRPKAFAWESVTNAWSAGRTFMMEQAEKFCDVGYHVTFLLQDNQFLGAAQARERVFLIAHKHPLVWPKLTKTTTVREALARAGSVIDDAPVGRPLTDYWKRLWRLSANFNGHLRKTFEVEGKGGLEGGKPSFLVRRLAWDRPAPVMISGDHRLHPSKPRELLWHEWLALCGLPRTWRTAERGFSAGSAELARAVLPPVGKWLGTAVKNGLSLPPLKGRPSARVVDLRDPERPIESHLFDFDGFTMKPTVPAPLPRLDAPKVRTFAAPTPGKRPSDDGSPAAAEALSAFWRSEAKRRAQDAPEAKPGRPTKVVDAKSGVVEVRTPRLGSGFRIRQMLVEGKKTTDQILDIIHKEFPGSKAKASDVYWNKRKLEAQGGRP